MSFVNRNDEYPFTVHCTFLENETKDFLQSTGSKHVIIFTLCIPTVVYRDHFYVQYNSVLVCVHVYKTVHA